MLSVVAEQPCQRGSIDPCSVGRLLHVLTWRIFTFLVTLECLCSLLDAVLPVPLRAAPCFHILLLSNLLWSAKQHSLCACLQMAFLHTALAIILVCVFKYSERLPLGVLMFAKGLTGSVLVCFVFFLTCTLLFRLKRLAQPEKECK